MGEMRPGPTEKKKLDRLSAKLSWLWKEQQDRILSAKTIQALDDRYDLSRKMAREPGVERSSNKCWKACGYSTSTVSVLQNKKILDIACGSNTSKLPAALYVNTPFGEMALARQRKAIPPYSSRGSAAFCWSWGQSPVGLILATWSRNSLFIIALILEKQGLWIFYPSIRSTVSRIAGSLDRRSSRLSFRIRLTG